MVFVLARSSLRVEHAPARGLRGLTWIPLFVVLVISSLFFNNERQQPGSGPTQQVEEPLVGTEAPPARKKFNPYSAPVSEYEMEFLVFSVFFPSLGIFGLVKLYGDVQRGVWKSSRKNWSLLDNSRVIEMISVEKEPLRFWGIATFHLLLWLTFFSFGLMSLLRLLAFWFWGSR